MTTPFKGDVGTVFIVDCGVDTSAATSAVLIVRKPDGSMERWTASPYTLNSVPNYVSYSVVAGDLDQSGKYVMCVELKFSGWSGLGEEFEVQVRRGVPDSVFYRSSVTASDCVVPEVTVVIG